MTEAEKLAISSVPTISEGLKWMVKQAGITRSELADRLGVTKGSVDYSLRPGANLRASRVARIARACGFRLRLELEPLQREAEANA